jgi:hypothetical protein
MQTGFLFGGLIIFLLGLIFVIVALVNRNKAKAAEVWPVTPGQILSCNIEKHISTDSDGDTTITYEPKLEYSYSIMGAPMQANRISYGAVRTNYKSAQKLADRYPVGSQVSVHYNPEKPTEAVLETAAHGNTASLVIGIVFMLIGVFLLIISLA